MNLMNEDRLKHFKNTLDAMINDESEMHRNRLKDAAFYFYKQAIQRVQELEEEIKSHAPEGRNYTNKQYVDLLHENKRYRERVAQLINYIEMTDDDVDQQVHKIHVILDKTLEGEE